MFDSRHLRIFHAVVAAGSYSAAARELGYSQPAISQQMHTLERAVGTPLFTRVGRTLRLTEAGEILARHAVSILEGLSSAQEQVASLKRLRSGRVRLCTFPSASATIVATAVARLTTEHPGIRVELIEAEPPDSLAALQRGECDLTLAFTYPGMPEPPARPGGNDLVTVPLLDDPVVVVLPKNHPLQRRRVVRLTDLADERWIAGCPRCRVHFVRACGDAGFEPDIAFTTDDNLAVQSLVAAGVGIALMPGLVLSFLRHPKVVGRRIEPAAHRSVSAYTLKDYARVPATRMLLETLRDVAAQVAPDTGRTGVGGTSGTAPDAP
jgi:DNA-binding transcriptional LysR family regulator